MADTDPYVMLITSLPTPEALFLAKQPPLSRIKLDRRLKVLSEEDARLLAMIEATLEWQHLSMDASDRDVIDRARRFVDDCENETLRTIVRDRLEIRTIVAAMRRRYRGESAPPSELEWGFGRWTGSIATNWNEAAFGLDHVFPWLREADRLMREPDTLALERLILEQSYRRLQRVITGHEFDFIAVVIYVLKWSIVDRWGRYNGEAAARRFAGLTEEGLGHYTQLSFEG
jgi:hypothetical protein